MEKKDLILTVQKELNPLYMKARDSKYDFLLKGRKERSKEYRTTWQENKQYYSKADISLMDWSEDVIFEKLTKIYEKSVESMAEKIESKLKDLNISSIELDNKTRHDFKFKITTPTGNRVFWVNTIQAGGYNVQCLHYRTTYKLEKNKNINKNMISL